MPSPWPRHGVNSPAATRSGRWRREVKASFVSHTLAGFGRTERPARCGNIGVVPPLLAVKTKLLAAGEDDPGLQIYRYSDKPELRGALRGERSLPVAMEAVRKALQS